jgi:hypothetical protein
VRAPATRIILDAEVSGGAHGPPGDQTSRHGTARALTKPCRVDRAGCVCQTNAIRTTLDIDDDLMRTLLGRLPGHSKTDAIEHAIERFLADDAVDRLKSLAGTMEIEDLSHELRERDRTT